MGRELMAIYEREAIANLRRCGQYDLADHYERAPATAPPFQYAGGDRDLLHRMWMGRELMAIYEREAIANLRRCGQYDLADHYERAPATAPPFQPPDYVDEAMRSLGLE